ncbi:MAG: primosomal protein N' [Ignavibacterium sp.]|nr:primosomal protein N' [Ignavibacterium sp.]
MYAEVVFPLPFRRSFTYEIPSEFIKYIKIGVRVVAPFGKRTLTGFVINISQSTNVEEEIKSIKEVIDEVPVINKTSLKFYEWLSEYYLCSLGEALKLAVPTGTEIESKKMIYSDRDYVQKILSEEKNKKSIRHKILLAILDKPEISLNSLQKAVGTKNIYTQLRNLQEEGVLTISDELSKPKVRPKKEKFVRLKKNLAELYSSFPELERKSPNQIKILLVMLQKGNEVLPLAELLHKTETSKSSIDSLVKKGFVEIFEKEVERKYNEVYSEEIKNFKLTEHQQKVIDEITPKIENNKFQTFLLHGITGSGKTQVYIELTKKAFEKGKSVLILVPEISLTPQMASRFFNNFGDTVSVIHSRMSDGERFDAWRKILRGKSKIVVGARSALFAPLDNIGLIVVDEEHDSSYKQQDLIPRYNARDSAVVLGQLFSCPVVLGSATPSIESRYNAEIGKYIYLQLPERIDNAKMPNIISVNVIVEEKKGRMQGVFSKLLLDKIEDRLKKKEGIILLQNRRGFSTQIYCEDCGEIEICVNCSVPLVYHINKNILQCHYCGSEKKIVDSCSTCGSINLKHFGVGTEKVEDELQFFFPNAVIKRIDSDSITKKNYLGNILLSFSKGEIDILVGTQMVSKGLDFPRVTLVGVISAENTLWLPDFRADERTFQLLTQVAGRSGRSKTAGEVIIQTKNDKHFVIQKVLLNDYEGFYKRELLDREKHGYPPFSKLALIETKDKSDNKAKGAAFDFRKALKKYDKLLSISEPTTAMIYKLKGFYRYQILIKSFRKNDPSGKILRSAILDAIIEFKRISRYRDVKLFYDIDPQSIM